MLTSIYNMNNKHKESLEAWDTNAEFWDSYMGDESNFFHCDLVRPYTERLLDVQIGDLILDIACGNGNFSERLTQFGAKVVAFDYSDKMVELARKRRVKALDSIEFKQCDATSWNELLALANGRKFNKAVANMAIMDISDVEPLFKALSEVLCVSGSFVFSTHHPCFTQPNEDYFSSCIHKGVAVEGQPVLQNYYHRSMQDIFNIAFKNGFYVDGFHEVPFDGEKEPIIMIVRVTKKQ